MPLSVYRRPSGYFHIRGTHHGIRVDRSARTTVRSEAEAVREKLERDIFQEQIYGKKPARSFAEAVIGYVRGGGEDRYLSRIVAAIGDTSLKDVSQSLIDHVALTLYPNAKPSTRNRHVYTPISAVLRWAAREKWIETPEVRRPRQPAGRPDWRTPEQIEQLLAAAAWTRSWGGTQVSREIPFAGLLTFLVGVGCRISEALELEWRDVSPDAQRVTFWKTKGGHPHGKPAPQGDVLWLRQLRGIARGLV